MLIKLRKVGNSLGVLLPREVVVGLKAGDEIDISVRGQEQRTTETPTKSLFKSNDGLSPLQRALQGDVKPRMEWCDKHRGWKTNCGCK